jgi:L-aspartate oxidase
VYAEIAAGRGAFLDARTALGSHFADEFPTVYESCISAGIDPATQPIPIAPAAHYHMGGIAVDTNGRSSLRGLWAAGEVSCTGAHGANRLASNSLLEAVVFAARIAEDIAGRDFGAATGRFEPLPTARNAPLNATLETELRACMSAKVGVIRDGDHLASAVRRFAALEAGATSTTLLNMATTALLVATAAFARRESRGAHFRSDYPAENPTLADRTMTTLAQAREIAASLPDQPARAPRPALA